MIDAKIGDKLTLMRKKTSQYGVEPHPILIIVTRVGHKYLTGYLQQVSEPLEIEQVNRATSRFDMTIYDIIDHCFRPDLVKKFKLYYTELMEWKNRMERGERIIDSEEQSIYHSARRVRIVAWRTDNPRPVFEIEEEVK